MNSCNVCGVELEINKHTPPKHQRFCSSKCRDSWHNSRKTSEYRKEMRRRHRERISEYNRRYREKNRERIAEYERIRRQRKRSGDESLTLGQWQSIKEKYSNRCGRCLQRKKLTIDHVVPLSRGGNNNKDNIQPLCMECNREKFVSIEFYPAYIKQNEL